MTNVISLSEVGMINSLNRLDIISHNLTNASTNGYRQEVPISKPFQASLSRLMAELDGSNLPNSLAPQTQSVLDMAPGALRHTGNALDLAIEGSSYFEFSGQDGISYSRRGVFTLDAAGQLVTAEGKILQGVSGPIRLSSSEPRIDRDGTIWVDEENVGQLKLVNFADPSNLKKVGNNYFRIGNAQIDEYGTTSVLRQGYLEGSNVDVMTEMAGMMSTLRHLEITQRVVTGYDEIIETAINTIGEF